MTMNLARLGRSALLETCIFGIVLVAACATGPGSDSDPDADRPQRDVPSFNTVVPVPDGEGEAPQPDVTSDGHTVQDVSDANAPDLGDDDAEEPSDTRPEDGGQDTARPDAGGADTAAEHACVTSPALCAPGPGNECCTATCDAVAGCATSPGSCDGTDECTDPNRLTIGRTCTGCGPANAAGICGGETVAVCNAEQGRLCEEVACGGATYVCTNVGGVWQWRASSPCDDGDACTTGDACRGGVCGGEPAPTPCGDGVCTCGETPASCPADCTATLPANACANGVESRSGCGNARTISRAAAATGWSSGTQQTCDASNRHDDDCPGFDVGNDHTYALFMRAGERVVAELATIDNDCERGDEFNSYLKFRFHADPSAAGATSCPAFEMCAGGPRVYERWTTVRDFVAEGDGWLFVIVDGGASAWDEHRGYYTLSVALSRCEDPGCGC